jgi:3-keto-5-aminohexanoate cleavage enzyme
VYPERRAVGCRKFRQCSRLGVGNSGGILGRVPENPPCFKMRVGLSGISRGLPRPLQEFPLPDSNYAVDSEIGEMLMDPLIITVAPIGAEVTRKDNPNIPLTPQEIAEECYRAWNEGASLAHLHARDPDGNPTQSADVYREIIELVRSKTDMIIQVSTGGAVGMTVDERLGPVSLRPEMATLTCGTVNFGDGIFVNSKGDIERIARALREEGVKPEFEIFDAGMIENAMRLAQRGHVSLPGHFDFVMGVPGGISGDPRNLMHLMNLIPHDCTWTVAGIGRHELPLGIMAVVLGGHVRVGFEDNIYYSRGVLAKSNAQLVSRIARIAMEVGRPVAKPQEARAILRLK